MRLFVAIEIPEGPRAEAGRRLQAVRGMLPAARWVDPEKIHLTLIFLGAIDDAELPTLGAALGSAAARHAPFTLALAGGGTFPPRRPARVAWIGIAGNAGNIGDIARLAALQADVAAAAERAVGYQPESRPYNPHITLARCPENWPRPAIETFTAAFAGPLGEPFPVDRVALFESQLGSGGAGGARYRVAETFPLSPTTSATGGAR
jgi:RNA 2',3'-cyclic 3'-phosphodiesterase